MHTSYAMVRLVSGVRCPVSGVRCPVSGVRVRVRYPASGIHHPDFARVSTASREYNIKSAQRCSASFACDEYVSGDRVLAFCLVFRKELLRCEAAMSMYLYMRARRTGRPK